MTAILGINAFHADAAAALLIGGELVAAAEEERFTRIKHCAGFPAESVRFVLGHAGIRADDVDHVAVSSDPRANLARKARHALTQRPSLSAVTGRLRKQANTLSVRARLMQALDIDGELPAQVHRVEHHDAHLAHGYDTSPFDSAAVLSVDGMGDFVSTVLAHARGHQVKRLEQVYYPHSLGFLYNAITLYLGFPNYGDEYKVMGLAPYGRASLLEDFRRIVLPAGDTFRLDTRYFTHVEHGIDMSWEDGRPQVEAFHSAQLEDLLGPRRGAGEPLEDRHADIAASLQAVTEEMLLHLLQRLHERTSERAVAIAGGCAMNSVAVGKVCSRTPFERVYVPAGAADNGTAIGAALHVWHRVLNKPSRCRLRHAYFGGDASEEQIGSALQAAGLVARRLEHEQLVDCVVDAICAGSVVGWFQGRMEFGARALGHRSLLADPRRADMREIINTRIKMRERFRPFAPSVLAEHVDDYFEMNESSPFMERVLPIRPGKRAEIPAVTHVDGTGRLQTVDRDSAPLYWQLIERFRERTGVPMLLNTSLNVDEPIVRTPAEAIACFQRTAMDMLVLGNHVVVREGASA